ncbi:cytochrome c oxidase subunit II transmembrane domain-containing protein [Aneurinibacillus sp. Ricciae_BoGa-3]|uniref:cytochrome c oxidase subunit II n=1 Tax=Aneurinibacillus sp. Ricciae_BoGa-3 TaxID=3022697 RepID=UPI0023412BAA|nr:cytochrome c oxidase subunit II transmembrane domain-containing protein [Aneurinibacillus sp. Ricciae_BoGa-3]WCK54459.1 cytochrome c oxidase subunit II transmembrane domain-containing protein [Aneurinibacillus sp. Ricciae_BoGa-3]
MKKQKLLNRVSLFFVAALTMIMMSGCSSNYIVLDPKGPVGQTELHLIVISTILCAIVVIPVLAILVYIVYRFRDKPGNDAPYTPDWSDSKVLEIIWWGIPVIIIGILGYFTAKDTYALTKPPVTDAKPITIQVTNLNWKWLFQYPDQKIATVNYCEIPAGVPVQFVLTSDAPMNSFWVPQLGGQEYAMPGMAMRLWLQADHPGKYFGSGANFTGKGFAHMQFQVEAKPQAEFDAWAKSVKHTAPALTKEGYVSLTSKQDTSNVQTFSSYPDGSFEETVSKNGGQYYHHDMPGMSNTDMPGMKMNK